MRSKFKIPLLLAVLAVGAMGVSAASASAALFLAYLCENLGAGHKYKSEGECLELGTGAGGEWERKDLLFAQVLANSTNAQGFQISGATSVCKKAHFETNGLVHAQLSTLLIHPLYEECTVELAGTFKAKVLTQGCNYVFHAAAELTAATVDLECETGKKIVVDVEGLKCAIEIGAQTALKNVEYMNQNNGKVKVGAKVTGIAYTTNCAGIPPSGSTGEYREGVINSEGEPELGNGAATAEAEGLNMNGERIGVSVG